MSLLTIPANDVFSPVDAGGNPRRVVNQDAQRWGTEVERVLSAFGAGGGVIFPNKSTMDATLTYAANVMAWVLGDSTPANNGVYRKTGSSGSGSWVRLGDLPYSYIKATNAGAGTANAIIATTPIPVPVADGGALIAINVTVDNTASPVTVAFNGASALTIKTVAGDDVPIGGLTAGMVAAGYKVGTTFQLISDVSSAAIIATIQGLVDDAEAAAAAAQAAASAVELTVFGTISAAEAYAPEVAPDWIRTEGCLAVGDDGGALYKKVVSEPSHEGKFFITLDDAVTVAWYELAEEKPSIRCFAPFADYDEVLDTGTSDHVALQNLLDYNKARGGGTVRITRGDYVFDEQVIIYDNTTVVFEADAYIWRNWTTANSDWKAAVFINEHMPDHASYIVDPGPYTQAERNENIHFIGQKSGGFKITESCYDDAVDNSRFGGPYISLHFCDDCSVDGVFFRQAGRQVCVSTYWNDSAFINNKFIGGAEVYEVNYWIAAGNDNILAGNQFDSGDDNIGVGTNYNLPLRNLVVGPNVYKSRQGHAIQITQNRIGSTSLFAAADQYIQGITITGGSGVVGEIRNAGIRIDTTGALSPARVQDVHWGGMNLDHSNNSGHDNVNAYGIYLNGGYKMSFQGRIKTPERNGVHIINGADDVTLDLDVGPPSDSGYNPIYIDTAGRVKVRGRLRCNDRSAILATACALLQIDGLYVEEIPNNYGAVQTAGTTKVVANGLVGQKVSGATTSRLFVVGSTGTTIVHSGCDATGVDTWASFSAVPALYQGKALLGAAKSKTVTSGSIVLDGGYAYSVLCEGGVSDTLAAISGGVAGQEIEIVSGEAVPGTVVLTLVHGTGANAIDFTQLGAANYLLNAAGKGIRAKYQDGTWRVFARW